MDQRVMGLLGLTAADVRRGVLRTGEANGPTYLSANPKYPSAIAPRTVVINSLADLQALVGTSDASHLIAPNAAATIPAPWPEAKNGLAATELSDCEEQSVLAAVWSCLTGRQDQVNDYAMIMEKRYFPMKAAVFAAEEVIVDKDHPLMIEPEGHDPRILTLNSLTLQPGAQIICEAPAVLIVDKFIKADL